MKIAMLSPLSWRTPPRHYRPRENVVSLLTEQLGDYFGEDDIIRMEDDYGRD
jgi:hypothetical protein